MGMRWCQLAALEWCCSVEGVVAEKQLQCLAGTPAARVFGRLQFTVHGICTLQLTFAAKREQGACRWPAGHALLCATGVHRHRVQSAAGVLCSTQALSVRQLCKACYDVCVWLHAYKLALFFSTAPA